MRGSASYREVVGVWGTWPGAIRRPLGALREAPANDFWVVLSIAYAFSSRRAPYAPVLLRQGSRYSAVPG